MVDAVLCSPNLEIDFLFQIAGDAMAILEEFLTYIDRRIGDDDGQIYEAEDIAILQAKLYYTLESQMETHVASLKINSSTQTDYNKYKGYLNCLCVAGFKCAEQGKLLAGKDDPQYAKLAYYMGNFGVRLLENVEGLKDSLYQRIGKDAQDSYEQAQTLILAENFYYVEENMALNIQSGLRALQDKGFD